MKSIAKKIMIYSLAGIMQVGLGATVVAASPLYNNGPQIVQLDRHDDHDQHWREDHDRQWRDHDREWRDHDRAWREHEGDRAWRERHAHEWHDWYRWHHDNGDEGFNAFIMGVIAGAILGNN
jgi:hypothetical protein